MQKTINTQIKINTWGNFKDKNGRNGRILIEQNPESALGQGYMFYEDWEDARYADNWYESLKLKGLLFYLNRIAPIFVDWEESEDPKQKQKAYTNRTFIMDTNLFVYKSKHYLSHICKITRTEESTEYDMRWANLPLGTKGYKVELKTLKGELALTDYLYSEAWLQSFLNIHDLNLLTMQEAETMQNKDFISKIITLRDLAQSRHLLIREQIELSFLEKIQAADSLAVLQSIDNELNNTLTDPELIKKLIKYTANKKAFY